MPPEPHIGDQGRSEPRPGLGAVALEGVPAGWSGSRALVQARVPEAFLAVDAGRAPRFKPGRPLVHGGPTPPVQPVQPGLLVSPGPGSSRSSRRPLRFTRRARPVHSTGSGRLKPGFSPVHPAGSRLLISPGRTGSESFQPATQLVPTGTSRRGESNEQGKH